VPLPLSLPPSFPHLHSSLRLSLSLPPSTGCPRARRQSRRHTFVVGIVANGKRGPHQSKVEQLQLPLRILDPASAASGRRAVRRGEGGPASTRTVRRRQAHTHITRAPDRAVLGFGRLLQRELKRHARNVYVPRHHKAHRHPRTILLHVLEHLCNVFAGLEQPWAGRVAVKKLSTVDRCNLGRCVREVAHGFSHFALFPSSWKGSPWCCTREAALSYPHGPEIRVQHAAAAQVHLCRCCDAPPPHVRSRQHQPSEEPVSALRFKSPTILGFSMELSGLRRAGAPEASSLPASWRVMVLMTMTLLICRCRR